MNGLAELVGVVLPPWKDLPVSPAPCRIQAVQDERKAPAQAWRLGQLPPAEFETKHWAHRGASITPEHYPGIPVPAGAGPSHRVSIRPGRFTHASPSRS